MQISVSKISNSKHAVLCFTWVLILAGFGCEAYAQKPSTSAGSSVADQARGMAGLPGAGVRITIHMLDAVDSAKAPAGQFRGTVKTAINLGDKPVPAGSNAVVRLVPGVAGRTRTFTLSLVSVVANGAALPVSGGSPSLTFIGLSETINSKLQNIQIPNPFDHSKKPAPAQKPATPAAPVPTVSGTRVYVPAGSEIAFTLAQASPSGTGTVQTTPTTDQPTQPAPAGQSSATVLYENIQYQLQGCQREAPHIICRIQITNMGAHDAILSGGQGTYYFDQSGNKVGTSQRRIANCEGFGRCELLPGLATAATFEFTDQDGNATVLKRLAINENRKEVAQFTEVPVQ
jgi:hypothetical protein